jgi:hypothetical protein
VAEFVPKEQSKNIPTNTRGIYALLHKRNHDRFDVVYVGMSGYGKEAGIYARLDSHKKSKRLGSKFTHFTLFEVHDNITAQEVRELEGLFRHMYRKDSRANKYNKQLCHKPFRKVLGPEKRWKKDDWEE